MGLAPRPVAPSSRISPPEPVAAPGKGEMAVGWLCVSTLQRMWMSSVWAEYSFVFGSVYKLPQRVPVKNAELSLYAERMQSLCYW